MFRIITLGVLLSALMATGIQAQKVWTLQECVDYARKNSLRIKQAQNAVELAELDLKGSQLSRLPNVNGQFSGGYNFGKSINPTTNQFESNRNFSGTGSLSSGVVLYDGFRINNQVKQSRVNIDAAELDVQAEANNVGLLVAQAYLNILLAQEQLANARNRLALSERQLEQTDRQIRAGVIPENQRFDFLAQIALDQQAIIEAENLLETSYLNLKQLMEVDPNADIQVAAPESVSIPADAAPGLYNFNEVYAIAENTQPQIRAGELRIESAEIQEKIARAGMLPTLSLFGNINTRFFNLTPDFTRGRPVVNQIVTPALINGENASITFFQPGVEDAPRMSFFDQLNNFFGQGVGFSLSIPIYNNHRNAIAIERARITALNQQVLNRQARQQLKSDVQRAVANAKASQRALNATEQSLVAARTAFENAQKRYDLGAINSLEFTTARNTLDQGEVNLTRAKYQYLFDLKVVDFYLGRELKLE